MKRPIIFWIILIIWFPINIQSQSILNTVHNLSVSGPGTIKATSETEICIFCHTPHNSSPSGPLWNRSDPGSTYILYGSSTTQATIGQPDGSSILCLSCHDGTIALGSVLSESVPITFGGGITTMPTGTSNLTTDLGDDHPISFVYNSALATADGELLDPSTLVGPVKLENSKVQCVTCHDPHANTLTDFLVLTNQNSELCITCHNVTNWADASHKTSGKAWNGNAPDPWPRTTYTTVAQNACENCHSPHSAGGDLRLLQYAAEESNCYICHNGNVAGKNIQAEFAKTYRHNVSDYTGVHDPTEEVLVNLLHVECIDCHNSHQANSTTASAPNANGFTKGVAGINQAGSTVDPIQFEYELCYRCHTNTPGMPSPASQRQIVQNNVRMEFASTNPSRHPVTGPGANPNVPSLIAPLTTSSVIYCTDCHASNGTNAPVGPHGSIYPQILKLQYLKANNTSESSAAYALCYSCHSRTSILNDNSFKDHNKHIVGERTPCNYCHDPHGISSTQGNSTNNSNLINFYTGSNGITPSSSGILRFDDQGLFKGRCYLTCHGKNHNPLSY